MNMEWNEKIKEYLRSSRRGKAAHRLERDALADPFLYEAMEGLTQSHVDPLDGLIRLERQLDIYTPSRRWGWLYGTVAGVALLAGALFFIYEGDYWERVSRIVLASESRLEPSRESSGTENLVLTARDTSNLEEGELEDGARQTIKFILPSIISNEEVHERDVAALRDEESVAKTSLKEEREEKAVQVAKELPGSVLVGGDQITVSMKESLQELSEVVVTGVNSKTNSASTGSVTTLRKENQQGERLLDALDALRSSGSPPEKTTDVFRFNAYLASTYVYPAQALEKGEEGEILLSFEVNKKGVPNRIRVAKSFSETCHKEIVRLLEEGPKWETTPANTRLNYKVKLRINRVGGNHQVEMELIP